MRYIKATNCKIYCHNRDFYFEISDTLKIFVYFVLINDKEIMKKSTKFIPILLIFVFVMSCGKHEYPTTTSKEAREFYRKGEESRLQLYYLNALNNYLKAFELDSSFALAAMKSAQMYLNFGMEDSGAYYFEKAYQLASQMPDIERLVIEYYWSGFKSNENRMSVLADSLTVLCPRNFDVRIIDAYNKWQNLEYKNARKSFQNILKDYPNYIIAYNNIGYLYAYDGLFKEAVDNLEKYKRHAANQLNPYDSLAEIYIAIGRYYEAIHTLEFLIKNRHDEIIQNEFIGTTIYVRIAFAYRKLGQYRKALDYLQQAEQLFSSNYSISRIYLSRFSIYRELEQVDQMEKVLDSIKSKLIANEFTYQTAVLKIMKNEYDQVLKILDRYKTTDGPKKKSSREILITNAAIEGELNLKTGLYSEAAKQFKLAADTYYDNLNSTDLRIKEYISLGSAADYSAAINGLRQQIKVNPNCPLALIYVSEYYLKSGKKSEALTYISHFLNLWKNADPGTPLLRHAQSILAELNR